MGWHCAGEGIQYLATDRPASRIAPQGLWDSGDSPLPPQRHWTPDVRCTTPALRDNPRLPHSTGHRTDYMPPTSLLDLAPSPPPHHCTGCTTGYPRQHGVQTPLGPFRSAKWRCRTGGAGADGGLPRARPCPRDAEMPLERVIWATAIVDYTAKRRPCPRGRRRPGRMTAGRCRCGIAASWRSVSDGSTPSPAAVAVRPHLPRPHPGVAIIKIKKNSECPIRPMMAAGG